MRCLRWQSLSPNNILPAGMTIGPWSYASTLINIQQNMGWVNATSVFHLPSTIRWPTAACRCLCSASLQLVLAVPSPCFLLLPLASLWAAACCFCCGRWEACMSNAVLILWLWIDFPPKNAYLWINSNWSIFLCISLISIAGHTIQKQNYAQSSPNPPESNWCSVSKAGMSLMRSATNAWCSQSSRVKFPLVFLQ